MGANVTDLLPGDEVFGSSWTGALATPGTFAEFTVVPAAQLIKKPAGLTFEEAAASVMAGITALIAIRDVGKLRAGTRLLINGARDRRRARRVTTIGARGARPARRPAERTGTWAVRS